MASAASSMSCGLRLPSLSPSTPTTDQVDGMNCIGPTARSYFLSESYCPASVSVICWVLLRAVERDAVDAGLGDAVVTEDVAAEATVVGLDAPDGRDQLPRELAGRVGGVDDRLGPLVGREGGGRDAAGGGGVDDLGRPGPAAAGATTPGTETLAGASMACAGTVVPSGSVARALVAGDRGADARAGQAGRPRGGEHGQRHEWPWPCACGRMLDICWSPRGQVVLCRRSGRGLPRARVIVPTNVVTVSYVAPPGCDLRPIPVPP